MYLHAPRTFIQTNSYNLLQWDGPLAKAAQKTRLILQN